VIPAYSASLISSLTQKTPFRPFNSVNELIEDGTFKLLVANNTAEFDYFAVSTLLYNIGIRQLGPKRRPPTKI